VIRLGFGVSRGRQLSLKKPMSATEHINETKMLKARARGSKTAGTTGNVPIRGHDGVHRFQESTEYFENFGDIAGLAWFMNVTMRCGRRLKSVEVAL
jgi:hypothetical protein